MTFEEKSVKFMEKVIKCIKLNLLHGFYMFTLRRSMLVTKCGNFDISPEAVRRLLITSEDTSFDCNMNGCIERVIVQMDDILTIYGFNLNANKK